MISNSLLLPVCIAVVVFVRSGTTEGFTTAPLSNRQWGQHLQRDQHCLASSTVDDLELAATKLLSLDNPGKATASYGQFGGDEPKITKQSVGIESEFPKRKIKASVRETGTDSMKYYIKSMCNHELLNKNEEIILAREIQILLKWEAQREKLEEELLR